MKDPESEDIPNINFRPLWMCTYIHVCPTYANMCTHMLVTGTPTKDLGKEIILAETLVKVRGG